jgi:hypothetical protein
VSILALEKELFRSVFIERGIRMVCSELLAKHDSPTPTNRELSSNAIIEICDFVKQKFSRTSTEHGMEIDVNEQSWKHESSMRDNRDSDSKATVLIVID